MTIRFLQDGLRDRIDCRFEIVQCWAYGRNRRAAGCARRAGGAGLVGQRADLTGGASCPRALGAAMAGEEEGEEVERRIYPTETAALAGGKALLKANELDDAADAFGQALELAIAAHGEDSCATADYYMAYGDVLLRIVDESNDVFGGGAQPEDPRANQENTGARPTLLACAVAHPPHH